MGVKTFRPGFREQLHRWELAPVNEGGHEQQAAPVKATEAAGLPSPRCALAGRMGGRKLLQQGQQQGGFGSTSDADDPQGGEGHGQNGCQPRAVMA